VAASSSSGGVDLSLIDELQQTLPLLIGERSIGCVDLDDILRMGALLGLASDGDKVERAVSFRERVVHGTSTIGYWHASLELEVVGLIVGERLQVLCHH